MLANLRYLGHVFNPVSFYYCFDAAGERVEAIVADVNNIPWGERHPYVLARGDSAGGVLAGELDKQLHVSPLMGMDQTYDSAPSEPGEELSSRSSRAPRGEQRQGASTRPSRCAAASSAAPRLARLLARYPAMSLQVVAKIYAQALRLKLKGARCLPPPRGEEAEGFITP